MNKEPVDITVSAEAEEPQIISHNSVPLDNTWAQRPTPATLHSTVDSDGRVKMWIAGMNVGNYADAVGPERAAQHRLTIEGTYRSRQFDGRIRGFARTALGHLFT